MTAIVVENLLKRYGRFAAVDNVSFEVTAGQMVALLSPNGAGETTTIDVLEDFLASSAGPERGYRARARGGSKEQAAAPGKPGSDVPCS